MNQSKNPKQRHFLFKTIAFLILTVLFGWSAADVMAQTNTDFSGTYRISNGGDRQYYLVPAKDPIKPRKADAYFNDYYRSHGGKGDYPAGNMGDKEKPFLTTHTDDGTMNIDSLIWIIEPAGDYYYIKHANTGKYLVYEYPYKDAKNRKSVHLQTTDDHSSSKYKFDITGSFADGFNIRPIDLVDGNKYLNPATKNSDLYRGESDYLHVGMIGVWSGSDGSSLWFFETPTISKPVIQVGDFNDDHTSCQITITSDCGGTIYYTTEGEHGAAPTSLYTGPISCASPCLVKAKVVKYGIESAVKSKSVSRTDAPVISLDYDNLLFTITPSQGTEGSTIYYTTDDVEPYHFVEYDPNETHTLVGLSQRSIRAYAFEEDKLRSGIVSELVVSPCPVPQINVNYATGRISITCADPQVTLRYTIDADGVEPDEESPVYTGPFTLTDPGVFTIMAKAFRESYTPSETASAVVEKLSMPTIQADNAENPNFITITSTNEGASIYYTFNGSTPTSASYMYVEPLDFSYSEKTIKAIARKPGAFSSDVATESITLKCPKPEIFPDYETNLVYLFCDADDAAMFYTTDGTDPVISSTSHRYTVAFPLPSTGVVKAYAKRDHCYDSDIETFSVEMAATPVIRTDEEEKYITISTATIGAAIYYTIDGSEPTDQSMRYTGPFREGPNHERVSDVTIKAIAVKPGLFWSQVANNSVLLKCEKPRILHTDEYTFTFSCAFPTSEVNMYYTMDGSEATSSSTPYTAPVVVNTLPMAEAFHARAYAEHYKPSEETEKFFSSSQLEGQGDDEHPYLIESDYEFTVFVAMANVGEHASDHFKLVADVDAMGSNIVNRTFSGVFESAADDEGNFFSISNLSHPMFKKIDAGVTHGEFPTNRGIVRNVVLKNVNIVGFEGNTGAIACEITGGACIYNCGILSGKVGGVDKMEEGTVVEHANVGGLVGLLNYTPYVHNGGKEYSLTRVVNCYSYADITSKGADVVPGTSDGAVWAAGIVGNNMYGSKMQNYPYNNNDCKLKTAVVNCMFYGDIATSCGSNIAPVYGFKELNNSGSTAINNYNYFLKGADFSTTYTEINQYNKSWPAEEKYLTRYEYYRSILNSNRLLCTFYVTGKQGENVYQDTTLIAKWVRDESIAPYPILKRWGKYPSIINPDPERVWDTATDQWISRVAARDYQGKSFGTLSVTVKPGVGNYVPSTLVEQSLPLVITDIDTLHYDYGYYKVQLPYYNEVFGDGSSNDHITRYGGNYTDQVVTGWKITKVNGESSGTSTFVEDWESGYNFADRKDKFRDLYSKSSRVYAQGGFYYVPEDVTSIEIEAYWGKAVYLRNKDQSIDRVNVTNSDSGNNFIPAGQLPSQYMAGTQYASTVYESLQDAIQALGTSDNYPTVYDQAIVLVGNLQVKNKSTKVGSDLDGKVHPFTLMSADFDLDNEPDYCLQLQFRGGIDRPPVQPIRFDFLAVPDLGMAIRHNERAYSLGIMVPQGHFEVTETAFMHFTQFECDAEVDRVESPIILNGGQFDQIVIRYTTSANQIADRTSYFLLGGHVYMKRFTPGAHANMRTSAKVRLCAVNCIGGEYPEFYLSGIYRPDINPNVAGFEQGNPHCYTNGGKFGTVTGSGYDKIMGDVTFKIDHSVIREFYGGGINAVNPIDGHIDVTIDHSVVGKYCGGPKVGEMADGKTVTTRATGTTFGQFYGGGNGGTGYYREQVLDGTDWELPTAFSGWESLHSGNSNTIIYNANNPNLCFNPLNTREGKDPKYDAAKGYHDIFEFEVFNSSNGLPGEKPVIRTYVNWANFGATKTGSVNSTLTDCVVMQDFYGGGNLGEVDGNAVSTLDGNTIIYGSAYGGGFSAAIPKVRCYDVANAVMPYVDPSGVMHNGELTQEEIQFVKDADGKDIYYEWTNTIPEGSNVSVNNPLYQGADGKWYCYTGEDITGLGIVTGNTTLNVNGNTKIYGRKKEDVGENPDPNAVTFAGAAFGGGNESEVLGNSTITVSGTSGLLVSNVYGGGNLAVTRGNSQAIVIKGTIGVRDEHGHLENSGSVYGGGKGREFLEGEDPEDEETVALVRNYGRVRGNSSVVIRGGKVLNNVYGGGQMATVGMTQEVNGVVLPVEGTGVATVTINGGEVGPLDMTGLNAYVYGGGQGKDEDPHKHYKTFANVNKTIVTVNKGTIWGSVFGGGADGHVMGDAEIYFNGGTIGTDGTTSWDGNIFGGGRNYLHTNLTAGRVEGNIYITMLGGEMKGNIFGGGRLGLTGVNVDGEMLETDDNGHVYVDVRGGVIGTPVESPTIGHIFGGGKGIYKNSEGTVVLGPQEEEYWRDLALVKETHINISGNPTIYGNVYGGGELAMVRDDATVTVDGGTIGSKNDDATIKSGGCLFGGGKGHRDHKDLGWIKGNTTVLFSGGQVMKSMYAGGEIGNVGQTTPVPVHFTDPVSGQEYDDFYKVPVDGTGVAHLTMTGGELGYERTLEQILANPVIHYVYGGGKSEAGPEFNTRTNVNQAFVNIQGGHVWGSVFGGGEDGHVLGDVEVTISENTDTPTVIGTYGYSGVDGNIFSGGRGFNMVALTAGGVGGNIHTTITGGTILGSVYGGGRSGSVGFYFVPVHIDPFDETSPIHPLYGQFQDDVEGGATHGHITVDITGGSIGHDGVIPGREHIGGNVYGGSKGIVEAPSVNSLAPKMAYAKSATVNISETAGHQTFIRGSVFGGGEDGHIRDHTSVIISGGQIGGHAYNPSAPSGCDDKFHGNVYGGGRGLDTWTDSDGRQHYSASAGRVYGSSEVSITGGRICRNVYGGGSMASVGQIYTVDNNAEPWGTPVYYDIDDVTISDEENGRVKLIEGEGYENNGHATVSITGGTIGIDGDENGHVFGSSRGTAGPEYKHLSYTGETFVSVNMTGEGKIFGSVFGGGEDGHVLASTNVDIKAGKVGVEGSDKTYIGNVYGGGRGVDMYTDENGDEHYSPTAGWVKKHSNVTIEGGLVYRNVYGGGNIASVGIAGNHNADFSGLARVTIKGNAVIGTDGNENGHVFGSGYGRPAEVSGGSELTDLAFVKNTIVTIDENAQVKGSVFGSGENGHVRQNTHVYIKGGIIGVDGTTGYEGNVYGGGRGRDKNNSGHFSRTAGKVYGNVFVQVEDGLIKGSVFGGGRLGSVGTYPGDSEANILADMDYNNGGETGRATVRILGGIIGSESDSPRGGNVYGGGKGLVGPEYEHLTYLKNTEVIIRGGRIKGSVFGSGEDGHVYEDTKVVLYEDDPENPTIIGFEGGNQYKGNVYGGGRGIDRDAQGNLSETAGIVRGHTRVFVKGGTVWGNVYGGGNESLVKLEKVVNINGGEVKGSVFGGCNQVPLDKVQQHPGLKTVNVRGGWIRGNVYGCSRMSNDGNYAEGHEKDWTSFVNISGGNINGNVYGMGFAGEVKGSSLVNVGINAIAVKDANNEYSSNRNADNIYFDDRTYVPTVLTTGVFNIKQDEQTNTYSAEIDGYVTALGDTRVTERGVCWSLRPQPTITDTENSYSIGTTIGENEEGRGEYTKVLTDLEEGQTYYARAYANNSRGTAYGDEICFVAKTGLPNVITEHVAVNGTSAQASGMVTGTYTQRGICYGTEPYPTNTISYSGQNELYTLPITGLSAGQTYYVRAYATNNNGTNYGKQMMFTVGVDNVAHEVYCQREEHEGKLAIEQHITIGGSVFAGSDYYGTQSSNVNDWFHFDATGYGDVNVDGTDYDTRNDNPVDEPLLIISKGLYGSSSHCESGLAGRNIILRNFGHRNDGDQMTTATRTLTTIQRCGNLVLDNVNIIISGERDINEISGNTGKYAILKVDDTLYVANSSGIVLGANGATEPLYMDSIRMMRSVMLNVTGTNTIYEEMQALGENWHQLKRLSWDWIGIHRDDNKLYRIHGGTPTALDAAEENVILFNNYSRLWVRYTVGITRMYGELNGFFRMISPFEPYGTESFAHARTKLVSNTDNVGDGGFLSYVAANNNYTEPNGGALFTKSQQYPYTNVLQWERGDGVQYREWDIPRFNGHRWYVDGTRGWGRDRTKLPVDHPSDEDYGGWGLAPDKPKKTIFGSVVAGDINRKGGIITEIEGITDENLKYNFEKDIIYLVGGLSPEDEDCLIRGNAIQGVNYPLKLYRYPGGHPLSYATIYTGAFHNDIGGGTPAASGNVGLPQPDTYSGAPVDLNCYRGPGAYYGPALVVPERTAANGNKAFTLDNVIVDGLYGHEFDDDQYYLIPGPSWRPVNEEGQPLAFPTGVTLDAFTFDQARITAPLIVTKPNSSITFKGGTELKRNYNNTNADYYYNPEYNTSPDYTNGTALHGGAVYVNATATVNVEGKVTIVGNKQKNDGDIIESNVYLPTFAKYINITNALTDGSIVGITSPICNSVDANYENNTFSPIAVTTTNAIAANVWNKDMLRDDLNRFFGRGYVNAAKNTYYTEGTNTLYFGWTWNNVVTEAPTSYSDDGSTITISDEKGLAWLISVVNGLNGETADALRNKTVKLESDLNLEKYVWLPIGALSTPFGGVFDGQGHVITNLDIAYIGMGDGRYNRGNYGLFGVVDGGTIDRTFVLSGHIEPVADLNNGGEANIGGIVGQLSRANDGAVAGRPAYVTNSEAQVDIVCVDRDESSVFSAGGLVGRMLEGEVHSSMGMPHITANGAYTAGGYVGGLVGRAEADVNGRRMQVNNSFANPKFTLGATSTVGAGGLVGYNYATMKNCYTMLQDESVLNGKYKQLAFETKQNIVNCHGFISDESYALAGDDEMFPHLDKCYYYSAPASADHLGYQCADNSLYILKGTEWMKQDTTLFVCLNQFIEASDGLNDNVHKYARWARPGLAELNGDMPVLLMSEFDGRQPYQGGLRSVATYAGGPALQYGGPIRDGEGDANDGQLEEALTRMTAGNSLFIYGDINADENISSQIVTNNTKISIYEHAAILNPGTLANYPNTYVGVTFDNTSRTALDYYGNTLGRDWHMLATPLRNAPLGMDYSSGPASYGFGELPVAYPFSGDGYFPSQAGTYVKPEGEAYDYPYDFYCWYEPEWQWINFKRNGASHYHFDSNPATNEHEHIDYHYDNNVGNGSSLNLNESTLVPGKGYMMAVEEDTYMQSHGQLNGGEVEILATAQAKDYGEQYQGHNLVGNPFHAYLDFDQTGLDSYYLYDADHRYYITYPAGGSEGGDYGPRFLHPHQAFFIKTNTDRTVTFDLATSSLVASRDEASPSTYRGAKLAYPLVNLYAEDADGREEVLVVEFERPENGGGFKAKALRNGKHQLYARYGGKDYGAFFAKQGTERVSVCFTTDAKETSVYTLKWNMQNGDFHTMKLIDNLLGIEYDMLSNDRYTFQASKFDYATRFYIVFSCTDIEEQEVESNGNFAFFDGTQWVINGSGQLELVDMTGRVLQSMYVNGDQTRVGFSQYASGVYLLRLCGDKSAKVQKIVITQ